MVYYYPLPEHLANPYLLWMTCKTAKTCDELLATLDASGRITYVTKYVILVGDLHFSIDSLAALFECRRTNVPIYYV